MANNLMRNGHNVQTYYDANQAMPIVSKQEAKGLKQIGDLFERNACMVYG